MGTRKKQRVVYQPGRVYWKVLEIYEPADRSSVEQIYNETADYRNMVKAHACRKIRQRVFQITSWLSLQRTKSYLKNWHEPFWLFAC